MKNNIGDSNKEVLDNAIKFLTSREVKKIVKEGREHFQYFLQKGFVGSHAVDNELQEFIKKAEDELLPHLEKIDQRSESSIATYGLNLIRPWVASYINHLVSLEKPAKSLAKKYAHALIKEAVADKMIFREITPLVNFSADRKFSMSRKTSEISFRFRFLKHDWHLNPRVLSYYFQPTPWDLRQEWLFAGFYEPFEWILIIEKDIPRKKKFLGDESVYIGGWTHQVVSALKLFKDQQFHAVESYNSWNTLYMGGMNGFSSWSHEFPPREDKYHLSENDIREFRSFWRKLGGLMPFQEKLPPRISTAIRYFESSSKKPLHDRFLDLCIALEALFGIEWEIKYRLQLRVSAFFHEHGNNTADLYGLIGKMWNLRNKLAHGALNITDKKVQKRLQVKTPQLRKLVRKSIIGHMELFSSLGYDKDRYEKDIKDFERTYIVENLK